MSPVIKVSCNDELWSRYLEQIFTDNVLKYLTIERSAEPKEDTDLIIASKDVDLTEYRKKGKLCYQPDVTWKDIELINKPGFYKWSRFSDKGYEVTSQGDRRFSPFFMKIGGNTLENIYHLNIKQFSLLGHTTWKSCKGKYVPKYVFRNNQWTRLEAEMHPERLYIFTDNFMRTSGNNIIEEGWYYDKYKDIQGFIAYPSRTQAVLRGLPNAFPISTMYNCYKIQLFEKLPLGKCIEVWIDEINTILEAWYSGKYKEVHISNVEIGNGKYSRLTSRPRYLRVLNDLLLNKLGIKNGFTVSTVLRDKTIDDQYFEMKGLYSEYLNSHLPLLYELISLGNLYTFTDKFATTDNTQARIYAEILNQQ